MEPAPQRIQRFMLAALGPEPIGEAEEVGFVDFVEYLHRRSLDQLTQQTSAAFDVFARKPYRPDQRDRFDSIQYWYWEHWKFFRSEVKTSIVQGIAVFLSLFETDPDVRRIFCPPKELYEGKPCAADPQGKVMPPFDEFIESGKVVGLNFPVALNPALAKTIAP